MKCTECGTEIPDSTGFCPRCLFQMARTDASAMTWGNGRTEPGTGATPLPHRFGDYEILELLGEGGMGIVYKAVQKMPNRTVALKMLKSGYLATPSEIKRFEKEVQAVARLQHPNIVRLHQVGSTQGRLFFSMDYVQGQSLAQIVGRTPLAPRRAAVYCKAIAEAVHHAHQKGVLHRDLKPANVIVNEQDQPQVTDFGLAKELASSDPGMTGTGAVMGTPSYMSPEQAAGATHKVGVAADVYSLGAILYDLLTARPPFRADSPAETIRQVIETEPAPVRLLNPNVPRDLETICHKCLAKEPSRRFASARALAEDLVRFLRGEPIQARPAGRLERVYRWARRHPTPSALAAATFGVLLLVGLIGALSIWDAEDSVAVVPWVAEGIGVQFGKFGEEVKAIALNPEIVKELRQNPGPWEDLAFQTNKNNPFLQILGSETAAPRKHFENILILSRCGDVLANHTSESGTNPLGNRSYRDYFQRAMLTNDYCISWLYHSEWDTRYKVSAAITVRDADGTPLGVVAKMIGPEDPLGQQSGRTKTALISPVDLREPDQAPKTSTTEYAVFWHPGLTEQQRRAVSTREPEVVEQQERRAVPIRDPALVRQLEQVLRPEEPPLTIPYSDPVADEESGSGLGCWLPWRAHTCYHGRWIAGMARIPGTDLVLVYQIRDRLFEAELAIGVVALGLGTVLTYHWLRRRWRVREERLNVCG